MELVVGGLDIEVIVGLSLHMLSVVEKFRGDNQSSSVRMRVS